jgi:hypothetical protein
MSYQDGALGLGNGGGDMVHRLRDGIERFLVMDISNPTATAKAQSNLFIMMDLLDAGNATDKFNYIPGGCNFLYMDGQIEFVRYVNGAAGLSVHCDGRWRVAVLS